MGNNTEKLLPVKLSSLPEIEEPSGFWVFGSKMNDRGMLESGKFLFDKLAEYARRLQFERRISLRMESATTDMFIGEKMTIYRVEGANVAKLLIDNREISLDRDVEIEVAPKSIIRLAVTPRLTDPVSYLFIYAKAELL